jgi:hypothetical protein
VRGALVDDPRRRDHRVDPRRGGSAAVAAFLSAVLVSIEKSAEQLNLVPLQRMTLTTSNGRLLLIPVSDSPSPSSPTGRAVGRPRAGHGDDEAPRSGTKIKIDVTL